ncbi:MAG TPA: hypothetical protein VGR18_08655 [Rubrobacter sp.]|nr:hypothetical protein [Rubrobacter sp.]
MATADAPSVKIITTSDVYELATGGFFVLLAAYGRASGLDGGGISLLKNVRDRVAGCGLLPGPTWQIPALRQPC